MMLEEIICGTNFSFGLYLGFTGGAYNAISTYATDELKAAYLPKMVEGLWSGTMCLTEPQSGTDLGLVRTKAIPQNDCTNPRSSMALWFRSPGSNRIL